MAIITGVIFCLMVVTAPSAEASKWDFVEKLAKKDTKQMSRIAGDVNVGGLKRLLPDAGKLSRKFDLPEHMLTSPAVRKLAVAGEEIVSHGAFASRMLNKSDMPELVIHQYTRFGKKTYLKVAESVGRTMTTSKTAISASLSKLKGKYKGMNKIINKFNDGSYDDDLFVRTIRKTGKRGMEVLGWMANNPKLTLAGAGTAWYLLDPESFEDALATSGQKLGEFIGGGIVNVSAGVGAGVATGLQKSFSLHSMSSIIGGVLAIGLVLMMFSKTIRRLLLFPFTMMGKKANEKMDNLEQGAVGACSSSPTTQSRQKQPADRHKPRSNL